MKKLKVFCIKDDTFKLPCLLAVSLLLVGTLCILTRIYYGPY